MNELLQKNNIVIPTQITQVQVHSGKQTQSLIEEYKNKLAKLSAEIEKKNAELLTKTKKIAELQTQMKRDEQVLKKAFEEQTRLKRNEKKANETTTVMPQTKKANDDVPDAETIKNLFMDKLTSQLENFFGSESDQGSEINSADTSMSESQPSKRQQQIQDALENNHAKQSLDEAHKATSLEDKEKLLAAVRQNVDVIKADLSQLLKNTWAQRIQEIEQSMSKAKLERQKNIAAAAGSQEKSSAIEKEYMLKMETLNKQLTEQQKDKKKKEESVTKTMIQQEQRLKSMENEIAKMKKEREVLVQEKKYGEERFSKFKSTVSKDLIQQKKTQEDKIKVVQKLKIDLKKTDQLVQQKMSELKGIQKKVREEKERRQKEEERENSSQGIDIDVIKDWITMNTEQLLKQQELNEYLKKQIAQRDEIEDEMFSEGDRLTELSIQQERLQFEQAQILQARNDGEDYDEARDLDIEVELEDIATESSSITQTLDTLEEHLDFLSSKINKIREEINSFDMDSIQPPRFKGLNSVEMARATLKTFFMVMLDLNVYKRDIENKCIEQDEKIIDLQTQLTVLSANSQGVDKAALMRKHLAITNIVSKIGDNIEFLDNRETTNLELSTQEQNQLTKLSLSKIVSNLRSKLKDEVTRNQNLSLKIDALIKEKEVLKQKFTQIKKENKNSGQISGSLPPPAKSVMPNTAPIKSKINTGLQSLERSHSNQGKNLDNKKSQLTTQAPQPQNRRLSFKQRRDLMKESPKERIELKQTEHSIDSLIKQQMSMKQSEKKEKIKQDEKIKTNKQLADDLNELGDHINSYNQITPEERQARKRAYLMSGTASPDNQLQPVDLPVSFLTSPSQPETVPEVDEEDDEELKQEDNFLNDQVHFEDITDEAMQQLLDSGKKPKRQQEASQYNVFGASVIGDEEQDDIKQNAWKFEKVIGLPIESHQCIFAIDAVEERLFTLYDDMTLLEVNLNSKEIVRELNIVEIEDAAELCAGKKATSFAMFKDLNMLAISTGSNVHLFDYESEITLVTTLPVANVVQIAFIDLYIILLVESDDLSQAMLTCYQMDSSKPQGSITINQFMGQQIMMRQGEQAVFYATGMQFGKINVPEMELQYQEDSGHQIIDFAVSDTCLFSTGKDSSIRVFDNETGMMLLEPMAEMECDALSVQGYHLIARCGSGQAFFVFNYTDGSEELEEEDFIECDDLYAEIIADPTGNNRNFLMRGGLTIKIDSNDFDYIVVANLTEQGVSVNMLKGKSH